MESFYVDKSASGSGEKSEETDFYEKPKVKVLAEEDLPNYTIYDVLMPLQGTEVSFPENAVKTYFDQLLVENGMGADDFNKFTPRYVSLGFKN